MCYTLAMEKVEELLTRGVDRIYPTKEELEKILRSGKKLKIYQGFDPTSPQFHIGHMVGLRKLRQWQDLGHEVIFLIGDSTATIGDPSGKFSERKVLTREEVLENAKTYKSQAGKILNFEGPNAAKILYNSQWLEKLSYIELIKISHYLSVNQVIERDMFQKRIQQNQDIFMNEFMYPVLQAYDSVAMNVDVEVGGSDQMFNMMMGRKLMRNILKKEKFVMTTPLLTDSKGVKIGKTEGNAIALTDKPENLYAKIMGLPDDIITKGFEYLTDVSMEEIKKIDESIKNKENPVIHKKKLAYEIVKQLNTVDDANKAQASFENLSQKKEKPTNVPEKIISNPNAIIEDVLVKVGLASSKSEAKRLIEQNGVKLNDKNIMDPNSKIKEGLLSVGKRKFVKIKIK
jgi:tyrosyl-tRNA synthetase